jgi:TolB-like protein
MSGLKEFFDELQRRNVVRAAAAHLLVFWLLVQAADVVLPYIGVVDNPVRWAIVAGVALFPATLIIAWFIDHPWHHLTGSRLALDIVVILVITVTAASWVVRNIPQVIHSRTSIVILPFEHTEDDAHAQSLSRALAYEINGLLMKSKSIDVIGFESANSPLLAGLDLTAIADRLDVQHVLTGTIQAAGQSMNISISLHDRLGNPIGNSAIEDNLENLFSVQERIATFVAARLGAGDDQIPVATVAAARCPMPLEPAVLEKYYTARHYGELRTDTDAAVEKLRESIRLLEEIVEEYPEFSEARSGLAWALLYSTAYDGDVDAQEMRSRATAQAEIAFEQCPTLGEAMIILPNQHDHENGWIGMEQQFLAVIEMEPNKTENYQKYARHLREVGRLEKSVEVARNNYLLNPLSVRSIKELAAVYHQIGRWDEAEELYEKQAELGSDSPNFARDSRQMADCSGDAECLIDSLPPELQPFRDRLRIVFSEQDDDRSARASIDAAMALLAEAPYLVNLINATACRSDHLTPLFFEAWDFANANDVYWYWPNTWNPDCGNVWAAPEFPAFAESVGYLEYWQTVAWPDVCKPEGESFVCAEKPDAKPLF